MFLSFVKALSRKSRKLVTLAEVVSEAAGQVSLQKVSDAWAMVQSPGKQGEQARNEYSHVIFVVENEVRGRLSFTQVEAQKEEQLRAQQIRDAAEKLQVVKAKMEAAQSADQALRAEITAANEQARAAGLEEIPLPDNGLAIRAEFERLEAELEKLRKQPPQQEEQPPFELDKAPVEGQEPPEDGSPLVPK